ncbi:hypothetical protein VINE108521_15275 [Vibrio neonatus]
MGCCNKAPSGGTRSLAPFLKLVAAVFVIIFVIALVTK